MGRPQPRPQDYDNKENQDWDGSIDEDIDFDKPRSIPVQKWDDELDEFLDDYDDMGDVDIPNLDDDL